MVKKKPDTITRTGADFEGRTRTVSGGRGVSLILAILILGSVVAIALAISFLMFQEIKISGNAADSARAFYAADTGVEAALYFYKSQKKCSWAGSGPAGADSGGATYSSTMAVSAVDSVCQVKSTGLYKDAKRTIRVDF